MGQVSSKVTTSGLSLVLFCALWESGRGCFPSALRTHPPGADCDDLETTVGLFPQSHRISYPAAVPRLVSGFAAGQLARVRPAEVILEKVGVLSGRSRDLVGPTISLPTWGTN
jgi:hypothetical protein